MGSIPTRSRHPGPSLGRASLPSGGIGGRLLAVVALTVALAGPWSALRAQAVTDSLQVRPDSTAGPDSTPGPPVGPMGAFGRSLVLPGWGQAEVDRPVRGAVYFALESVMVWMVFKSQAKLSSAQRGLPADTAGLVEARTGFREDWVVLSAFVALMSGVDAYVSAHLYGFEGELEPPEDGSPGGQLTFRIPLRLP